MTNLADPVPCIVGCLVLFGMTIAVYLRALRASERAEADANSAACNANIAKLARDPLDVEAASRKALQAIEEATATAVAHKAMPYPPPTDAASALGLLDAVADVPWILSPRWYNGVKSYSVFSTDMGISSDPQPSIVEAVAKFIVRVNEKRIKNV